MATNTYAAIGNKDDISEIITNISPEDTPLYSALANAKATETIHQWLEDVLGEAQDNAQVEGYTYTVREGTPRRLLNNYTQIMDRNVYVTDTQEAVLKHGLQSEISYQMHKEVLGLAFDCERALLTQDAKELGSMSVPRKFGGLPYWIVTNVFNDSDLTFDLINDALEKTWNAGGKPRMLLLSPRNKRIVSTFTAGNTKYMDGNKTSKLTQTISVLETDFGVLTCKTDRFLDNSTVYGLRPEYMKKAFLRRFKIGDLPKTRDTIDRHINGEWTLEMRAEKSHFKITGLNGQLPSA